MSAPEAAIDFHELQVASGVSESPTRTLNESVVSEGTLAFHFIFFHSTYSPVSKMRDVKLPALEYGDTPTLSTVRLTPLLEMLLNIGRIGTVDAAVCVETTWLSIENVKVLPVHSIL